MSHYRHLDADRWAELEPDPTEAIFTETFSELPWELRGELDLPDDVDPIPLSELSL